MRTPLLVGSVVAVHCVAIGSVVLIQGCGTLPVDRVSEPKMPPQLASPLIEPMVIEQPVFAPVESGVYEVRKGDSLSRIAQKHGISTLELSSLNNIKNPNQIRIGQKLVVPGSGSGVSVPAPIAPENTSVRKIKAEGPVYTVKSGDSLSVIAHAYGVNIADIKAANGISSDRIIVGQKLTIPEPTKTPVSVGGAQVDAPKKTPSLTEVKPVADAAVQPTVKPDEQKPVKVPAETIRTHTVEEGDDIFSVAMMWGVSVSRIREVNALQSDSLNVGQKIKIPLSE